MWILFLSIVTLSGVVIQSHAANQPWVIYDDEDRREVRDASDIERIFARSTLAMIPRDLIRPSVNGISYDITGRRNKDAYGLCPSEKFSDQIVAADCSAFLADKDVVVTAGHCVFDQYACNDVSFVFDFSLIDSEDQGNEIVRQIPAENVYNCKEVIKSVYVKNATDFAILRLDRPALNRVPLTNLTLKAKTSPNPSDSLFTIGHPLGLPAKITGPGRIMNLSPTTIHSALDAFAGNSGAPVFNYRTLEIEGILVAGEPDFVQSQIINETGSFQSCNSARRCSEKSCRGERVIRISQIAPHLP